MKYRFFALLFCAISLIGCHDDLPELESNPLEDETTTLIEIIDFDYNPTLGKVEINYVLNYDFTENSAIVGIVVIIDDVFANVITDIDQDFFVERNLPFVGTRCYQLAFLSEDTAVRPSEEICIEL